MSNYLKFLKKNKKIVIFLIILFFGCIIYRFSYSSTSSYPTQKSFNKAFQYFLSGDCEKYADAYNIAFQDDFLAEYGDTDWPIDAIYQKRNSIAQNCRKAVSQHNILDVKIKNISREKFSDTAFIQTEITTVNNGGVHHIIPENFVMKNINDKWMLNIYCDTERDSDCK